MKSSTTERRVKIVLTIPPSLRFIPRLPAAQGQKTELEQMIRIEAQSRFLKQKKDALLESSDLEKLWNALQEQASKTPTSNGRISYQDFIEVRNKLSEKLQDYFSPSLFLKLEKDELGRISIITFFQFCMRKTSFCRARINIHTFDSSGAGYLTEQDMDNYISDMLKQFPMLKQLDDTLIQYYVCMATRKFFFFLDPMRIMHIPISKILTSSLLAELLDMREENISEEDLINNWFSPVNFHRVYENYLDLDKDEDGLLSSQELSAYATGSFSNIFINRIFQEFHTFQGKLDFKSYLNFILMLRYKSQPEGYITSSEVLLFVRDMLVKLVEIGITLTYLAPLESK
ncbi:MAG: putative Serine/threonine-protein phosphatase 2A regulatory subunit B'' subunit gamma, partial [Streblomastix strix]